MNDEQYFLANAYLDGELTVDERRIAEADPEVMTEVEQLRALQSDLRDVPVPTAAARESAIGAALAAFGGAADGEPTNERPADGPRHAGPPVVPFRPRPTYAKYLAVAAAFVAVAGLGIIVSQVGTGDDDSADTATEVLDDGDAERTEAMIESLDTAEAAESEIMADDGAGGDDMAADEGATEDAGGAEFDAEPATADTADTAAEDTADGGAESPTTEDAQYLAVPDDFDPEAPMTNDVELGVYGAYLIAERDAGRLPPTPNHACVDAQQILDEATLRLDDELVSVYIDVREIDGQVAALRTDSCAELLLGSLYAD
jgi:hypothetical protein